MEKEFDGSIISAMEIFKWTKGKANAKAGNYPPDNVLMEMKGIVISKGDKVVMREDGKFEVISKESLSHFSLLLICDLIVILPCFEQCSQAIKYVNMYSKLQFDLGEQNELVIAFKRSSEGDDVRDKMAQRFFENVDNQISLLRLQYDRNNNDIKNQTGTIYPVSIHDVIGILSGHSHLYGQKGTVDSEGAMPDPTRIVIKEGVDPRMEMLKHITPEVTDFHEYFRIVLSLAYQMGTTPRRNAGWENGTKVDIDADSELFSGIHSFVVSY